MTHKEQYEENVKLIPENFKVSREETVCTMVNNLIDALYKPELGSRLLKRMDGFRLKEFGIKKEPVNWNNLYCYDVKEFVDGSFMVSLNQGVPEKCPTLCDYITRFMKSYGWDIIVRTEWEN